MFYFSKKRNNAKSIISLADSIRLYFSFWDRIIEYEVLEEQTRWSHIKFVLEYNALVNMWCFHIAQLLFYSNELNSQSFHEFKSCFVKRKDNDIHVFAEKITTNYETTELLAGFWDQFLLNNSFSWLVGLINMESQKAETISSYLKSEKNQITEEKLEHFLLMYNNSLIILAQLIFYRKNLLGFYLKNFNWMHIYFLDILFAFDESLCVLLCNFLDFTKNYSETCRKLTKSE